MKSKLLFVMLVVSFNAYSQDFQSWRKDSVQAYGECRDSSSTASIMGRAGPEDMNKTQACVDAKMEKLKAGYLQLQPKMKSAAESSFKDYYAAWIGGMRALPPLALEELGRANVSAQATRQKLGELWARFEIEAGL